MIADEPFQAKSRSHALSTAHRGEYLECLKQEFQVFQAFFGRSRITYEQSARQAIEQGEYGHRIAI